MHTVPPLVAQRLAAVSQSARVLALRRESELHCHEARQLAVHELAGAEQRFNACRQVVVRRLLEAIDSCDLVAAEENLQLALSFSAKSKAHSQVIVQHKQAA